MLSAKISRPRSQSTDTLSHDGGQPGATVSEKMLLEFRNFLCCAKSSPSLQPGQEMARVVASHPAPSGSLPLSR